MRAAPRTRRRSAEVHLRQPAKVLIPMMPGADNDSLLRLAHWLAASAPVLLLGIVPVAGGENLSAGAGPARGLRDLIQAHTDRVHLRSLARVRVTYTPWEEIRERLDQEPSIELLILNWPSHFEALRLTPADLLARPPCDVAILRGPLSEQPARVLVPMRGGPHAESALRLGLAVSRATGASVTSLQVRPEQMAEPAISAFAGMAQVLAELPAVEQRVVVTEDRAASV